MLMKNEREILYMAKAGMQGRVFLSGTTTWSL